MDPSLSKYVHKKKKFKRDQNDNIWSDIIIYWREYIIILFKYHHVNISRRVQILWLHHFPWKKTRTVIYILFSKRSKLRSFIYLRNIYNYNFSHLEHSMQLLLFFSFIFVNFRYIFFHLHIAVSTAILYIHIFPSYLFYKSKKGFKNCIKLIFFNYYIVLEILKKNNFL